jgi:hypothetical protein
VEWPDFRCIAPERAPPRNKAFPLRLPQHVSAELTDGFVSEIDAVSEDEK